MYRNLILALIVRKNVQLSNLKASIEAKTMKIDPIIKHANKLLEETLPFLSKDEKS